MNTSNEENDRWFWLWVVIPAIVIPLCIFVGMMFLLAYINCIDLFAHPKIICTHYNNVTSIQENENDKFTFYKPTLICDRENITSGK